MADTLFVTELRLFFIYSQRGDTAPPTGPGVAPYS